MGREVWKALGKHHRRVSLTKLERETGLSEYDVHRGVAWLSQHGYARRWGSDVEPLHAAFAANPKPFSDRKQKKRSKMQSKARSKVRTKNPEYVVYVVEKGPKALYVKSFRSRDFIAPYRAAKEFRLGVLGRRGKLAQIDVVDEKLLGKLMRKTGLRVRPMSMTGRKQNPRNSLVKDALAAEAVSYKTFEEFSRAYWDDCARGIYWFASNEKSFEVGPLERRLVKEGKFFVSCNPDLALSGPRGKGKKYVVELDVTKLGSADFRVKRGTSGTEIRIVGGIERVKPMRIMDAAQAKRSWRWQKGLLPPSKDELFKFWQKAWEKEEKNREKEEAKRESTRERMARRAQRLKEEEREVRKQEVKERVKEKAARIKKSEKEREKREQKAAREEAQREARQKKEEAARRREERAVKKAPKKRAKKKAAKKRGKWVREKPKAKKKTTALARTNPGMSKASSRVNNPCG